MTSVFAYFAASSFRAVVGVVVVVIVGFAAGVVGQLITDYRLGVLHRRLFDGMFPRLRGGAPRAVAVPRQRVASERVPQVVETESSATQPRRYVDEPAPVDLDAIVDEGRSGC